MAATQGLVSFLVDPQSGQGAPPLPTYTVVDAAWCADVDALSPARKLLIRSEVASRASDDLIPTEAYKQALRVWHDAGYEVALSLPGSMTHPYGTAQDAAFWSPNAPLGTGVSAGAFSNAYIDRYTNVVVDFLQGLGDQCPSSVWLWNEPNLASLIKPGENCPPNRAKKPSSLSPQVFMSLVYATAVAIRRHVPAVRQCWPGPLSCLSQYKTDPGGAWVGQYLSQGLQYLVDNGAPHGAPWPFAGLWLNLEGTLDSAYAGKAATVLRALTKKFGLLDEIGVGEWGLSAATFDAAAMTGSFHALDALFDRMFFFQHPSYRQYGLSAWGVRRPDNVFEAKEHKPAFTVLQTLLAAR